MEVFQKLKSLLPGRAGSDLPVQPWASELVQAYESETERLQAGRPLSNEKQKIEDTEIGRQILAREVADRAEIVSAVLDRLVALDEKRVREEIGYTLDFDTRTKLLRELMIRLMRARLPYDEQRLAALTRYWAAKHRHLTWTSPGLLFRQIEQLCGDQPAKGDLAAALAELSGVIASSYFNTESREQLEKITELLNGRSQTEPGLAPSPWGNLIASELAGHSTESPAGRSVVLALSAIGKSKPSRAFMKTARTLLAEDADLAARLLNWVEAHTPKAASRDPNDDCIRGIIWMLAAADGEHVAPRLGAYAELCFKKVAYQGARSMKLGNGAIQTLGLLGGPHAIAALTRLKKQVRYPTAVQRIEATLAEAAERSGVDSAELEEMSLPTYGLGPDGERRLAVGGGEAVLRLAGGRNVELMWRRSGGRDVRSVPKELKAADPDGVKATRALQKEIAGTLSGQARRLEALWLADRRIPLDLWRARYLEHPLLRDLTQRFIWSFDTGGASVAGLPHGNVMEDASGRQLALGSDTHVRLWHPLHANTDEVLAWRQRLGALEVVQPFKQAHREVYIVTDAERETGTYSNRFAAHILRQHQFKALCDQRGWRFRLMGDWDSHNTPTRALPRYCMSVEYWVDMISTAETTGAFVYTLISTDQVRFVGANGQPIPLTDVPLLVFSELMRDVDLFVGITSVGNDPEWADGGPDGRFQKYWRDYAFGRLSAASEVRASVLRQLLPRLAIADRCDIDDRYLTVRGQLRTYKIHIGSGNIIMEPDGRYLCIVAGRGASHTAPGTPSLVLPFEEDSMLSLLLSKAFLLASDDRITDSTILSQIKQ